MMDLMTVGIFSGCFLVVLSLVWLLSFLTKEQSYEDGLRQQKGGRLAALGVNKGKEEGTGKNRHDKRQAKQQDRPAKAKKQQAQQQVAQPVAAAEPVEPVEPAPAEQPVEAPATAVHLTAAGKAAAAKANKKEQPKSNKMTIEEVDAPKPDAPPAAVQEPERVPVVEQIIVKEEAVLLYEDKVQQQASTGTSTPQQQSTPVSGNRQKKKAKGGAGGSQQAQQQAALVQPQDLMTAVRKTNFDDEELQNLIDILLNKQQNCPPAAANGSWVDPQTNEMKQLQRSLQDREMQLEVEQARVKDMSGRYQQIQRELGESKNQMQRLRNDFQGQINGLERAKMEAEQSFANVSHRQSYDIQNLNHQNQELVRQINELNGHLAVYRTRPAPEDVKAELEQAHSNELNNLHSQLSHRTNELASVKQQVQEYRSKMEGSEGAKDALSMELSKAKEQAKSLEKKCSMLQQNNQMLQTQSQDNTKTAELQSRLEELSGLKGSLEVTLGEVNSNLKATTDQLSATRAELEAKVAQWEEEKKALLAEKVSQVNGKAADQEADKAEAEAATKRQEEEFVAKLNQVLKEKEALVQKISTDQQQLQGKVSEADSLRTELESVKGQLKDAATSLEQQRAKNDELRVKNWKAVDALKKAEEGLEKAAKKAGSRVAPPPSTLEDKSSIVKQTEEKYVTFLARLFADVDFSGEESAWKSGVEAQIQSLKDKPTHAAVAEEPSKDSSEEIEKLEKQVNHYKSSLQETETLLHKLQASVEAEEAKWKQSLSDQQKELDALKEQNAKMESCVQSAEEMQEKLQQLQSQLIGHEAAKRDLEKTLAEKSDCESEEKQKLAQEIESLKEGKAELGLQVARMNQLVTAGQEALQQEQKTADLLREQLAKVKESPECKIADNSTNNEVMATSSTG